MPIDTHTGDRVRFTANAPAATPGQYRRPQQQSANTAMPVGGHSRVTSRPTVGSISPSLPVTKYAAASAAAHAR
jgi:hypothetical protein